MRQTVAHFSDSTTFGGTEQVIITLLASLDRSRWQPVLISSGGQAASSLIDAARDLDVLVHQVPPMPEGSRGAIRVAAFARTLRYVRPDIFHAHLTWALSCKYGLAGALLARVPAVVATQHLLIDAPLTGWQAAQHRLILSRVGCITAVSRHIARHLVDDLHLPPAKVAVVHNGIPLQPSARGIDVPRRAGCPTVLVPARLDPQKGHRTVLEAARLLPHVTFLLAGDGPMRQDLEGKATQMGIADRVHFLGFQADMAALYAQCDIVCLGSLFEGFPLSVLEAMAAARPVVAGRIPGIDEIVVDGETGLLVQPGDPTALAAALERLFRDPVHAAALGTRGRKRVEREFSAEAMAQGISLIYDRLLEKRA